MGAGHAGRAGNGLRCVHGLERPPPRVARQVVGTGAAGHRAGTRSGRPRRRAHGCDAARARQAFRRPGMAALALPGLAAGFFGAGAMVAPGDDLRAGCLASPRADGGVRGAPVAGHGGAVELRVDQSGGPAPDAGRRRREPGARDCARGGGCVARVRRSAASRRGSLRGWPQRRDHAWPRRAAQRADGADPVSSVDALGARRAGAARAGVDHEVLRTRPVAVEFAGAPSGRPRLHGVRDLVEEPEQARSRPRDE